MMALPMVRKRWFGNWLLRITASSSCSVIEEPKGAPSCRNIGAKAAAGDYIIFLDSDDLLAPWCLEQRVACFLQHPEADFLTFSMLTFERNTEDAKTLWNISTPERDLVRFLRGDAVWQTSGPIYRKDFFQFLGGFAEDLPYWQDYEFHVRTLVERPTYKKYLHLPPDCYNRRHSEGSISQQGFHSEEKLLTRITIYQDIMRLVEQRQLLNNVTGTAIVVFSFNQARKLVVDHKNLIAALDVWVYAGQKGKLKNLLILVGKYHLTNLYRHQLSERNLSIYLFLAKFTALLLPRKYKRINSTLCKVMI